ncbi:MAG: Ig-like domain-containing protein [Firmicutes bacterium]|nr:Ig-like domain-containing protein [Bacillota bacterium]
MKRAASLICLALCLVLTMSQVCFAAGLEITNISPKNGETGKQVQNMAIKLTFSENMMDANAIEANASLISIKDGEGNEVPFEIAYSEEKYPDQLWLIIRETLTANTEYTVEILPGVASASGSTLGQTVTSTFKTRNTSADGYINMGLMFAMLAVMFLSTRQAMKKADEQGAGGKAPAAVYEEMNPYKLAKEKGITVDEARKIIDSRREKQAKNAAKAEASRSKQDEAMAAEIAAQQKRLEEEYEAARRASNYHVKSSGSVVSRGLECPKAIVRMNRKKREAAEKAARKAVAKKGKK